MHKYIYIYIYFKFPWQRERERERERERDISMAIAHDINASNISMATVWELTLRKNLRHQLVQLWIETSGTNK